MDCEHFVTEKIDTLGKLTKLVNRRLKLRKKKYEYYNKKITDDINLTKLRCKIETLDKEIQIEFLKTQLSVENKGRRDNLIRDIEWLAEDSLENISELTEKYILNGKKRKRGDDLYDSSESNVDSEESDGSFEDCFSINSQTHSLDEYFEHVERKKEKLSKKEKKEIKIKLITYLNIKYSKNEELSKLLNKYTTSKEKTKTNINIYEHYRELYIRYYLKRNQSLRNSDLLDVFLEKKFEKFEKMLNKRKREEIAEEVLEGNK